MAKRKAKRRKPKSKITRVTRKSVARADHDNDKAEIVNPAPVLKDAAATAKALELLRSQDFLNQVVSATRRMGLVGEENNKLVVFLVGTSRVLDKPLCLFVKGPSSAGKNYLTDTVLSLFPESEWRSLTSSSKRSWNYLGEQLENKIVYLKELNEMLVPFIRSDFSLVRSNSCIQ